MPRFLFELKGAETTAASAEAMEFASLEDARQDAYEHCVRLPETSYRMGMIASL
jgi:hypothetical protein